MAFSCQIQWFCMVLSTGESFGAVVCSVERGDAMNRFVARLGGFAVWMAVSFAGVAQRPVSVPRADGHETPLLVYDAAGGAGVCAPLAVISHGAGGSENGYVYLAKAMAGMGYTAVMMGHRESGLAALRQDMRAHGMIRGVQALVEDPQAESARLEDVGAALKWAEGQCKGRIPFKVLLGHSMGAETVMLEVGTKNMIGVVSPPAGQDRFDAYVALSPEGPGIVFPDRAWTGIRKPLLVLTGTRDQSLKGGPEARQIPWKEMPGAKGGCQWMGVIDGATHMNFGNGMGPDNMTQLVTSTIASFLTDVRRGSCPSPTQQAGMTLQAK
jgi:predicted dienelactone hydrolase